ncbi:MAG: bile acid:sodium symporter family protein [Succinivibrio sp.]|nr:bile acid:sodium symporter family protein [Succinivibrio sp.]
MNPIILVMALLVILTYTIGLNLKKEDFLMLIKKPVPVITGLTGQLLILPLIAFLIAKAFNLEEVFFIGLVLIALCPGGSSSNIFTLIAKGDLALSVSLTALSSVITLFTLPFFMALYLNIFNKNGVFSSSIEFPLINILIQNILLMFIPIVLGVLTKIIFKNGAKKISRVLEKIAFPSLALIATMFFIKHAKTISSHLDILLVAIITLVFAAIVVSSLLSRALCQDSKTRRTIVIEVAMQNAAQAIALCVSPFAFNNEIMSIPAIIYALIMNIILLAYVAMIVRLDKKIQKTA